MKENPFMPGPTFIGKYAVSFQLFSGFPLKIRLLLGFFDGNGHSHGHTNHGVVAGADEAHHFYVRSVKSCFIAVKSKMMPIIFMMFLSHYSYFLMSCQQG